MSVLGLRNIREVVFRKVLLILVGSCLFICAMYLIQGRFELIPWILIPYFFPSIFVYLKIRNRISEKAIFYYFVYLVLIEVALRFFCEPSYVVDLIVAPGMIAMAALTLNRKMVLGLSIFLFFALGIISIIVDLYEPFPILYKNSDLGYGIWIFACISIAATTVTTFLFIREVESVSIEQEHLNESYRGLLATILHDLSNELFVAKLSVEAAVKKTEMEHLALKSVSNAKTAIEGLSETLNEIKGMYDLVKAKENLGSSLRSVPLMTPIKKLEFIFSNQLKDKNLTLKYDKDCLEKFQVFTEPVVFTIQILSNLLSNAIKFSNLNQVIQIKAQKINNKISVEIINLCERHVDYERIFKGFFTGESHPGTSGEKGHGLGLFIAQRQCQRLGIELKGSCKKISDLAFESNVSILVPLPQ
ncbi:MAG: HAMP domain-containing histidine kinase [Bdellovibrionaceae bacterium]|nr:HAMP domain-containing histidine kinase [Pseudobdellovibrionaceae bacterium]